MSDYFIYSPLTANTVARAADVNQRFSGVSAGFDKLPPPDYIAEDRITFCVDEGVANAYVANPALPITAYTLGLRMSVQALNPNTGPSTLNVSGLGVKQIIRSDSTALEYGDIVAGQMLTLVYDGYAFQLAMAFAEISPSGIGDLIEAAGDIDISGDLDVTGDVSVLGNVSVADEPYGPDWDNSIEVPTKNAIYDMVQALPAALISDAVFGPAWNGVDTVAPSKNAVFDALQALPPPASAVSDTPYGPSWDGVAGIAPSKNAVYDAFQSIPNASSVVSDTPYGPTWDGVVGIAPSKNAVYDIINSLPAVTISDVAYGPSWNAVVNVAPSKNAVFDIVETKLDKTGGTVTGSLVATDFRTNRGDGTGELFFGAVGSGRSLLYNGVDYVFSGAGQLKVANNILGKDLTADRGDGTGVLFLGNGGNNYLYYDNAQFLFGGGKPVSMQGLNAATINASKTITSSENVAQFGFSHSVPVGGKPAYHLYNGGGVTEWLLYQPAHATSDDFRIASKVANSIVDFFKIAPNGTLTVAGAFLVSTITTTGSLVVGGDMLLIATDKLMLQYAGGAGYIRTQAGDLWLGAGGNNYLQIQAADGTVRGGNCIGAGHELWCGLAGSGQGVLRFGGDSTSNNYLFHNGTKFTLNGGNLEVSGNVYAQVNRRCYQQGSPGVGGGAEIFMTTAAPTVGDGNNGDIWLQYV